MFEDKKPQASVNIPTDVLTPIIQARVSQVLIETLGDKGKILEEAVKQVLMTKVDRNGQKSNYNSDNTTEWVQWLVTDAIKKVIAASVVETVELQKAAIKKIVSKQLSNQKSQLVKQLADALVGKITNERLQYNITVAVTEKNQY